MLRKKQILYIDSSNRQRYLYLEGKRFEPINKFCLYETVIKHEDENSNNYFYFKGYDVLVLTEQSFLGNTTSIKREYRCLDYEVLEDGFNLNHIINTAG